MHRVEAAPLSREAYARYGDVIEASAAKAGWRSANQGSAQKSEHLAELIDLRSARPNLSVFRCAPRQVPFEVALLEKHEASTQVFVPMNGSRYLVIVALGADAPDLSTLSAFVATGAQGITYRPGVWHHPMVALDRETDFFCLVFEDGSAADCTEFPLDPKARPTVVIP